MTKQAILDEIVRTATANGGVPLGKATFERETGVRQADWFGVYWPSWGDAVREAGFEANELTARIDDGQLLQRYATLARKLGRRPVKGDLKMMRRSDPSFPHDDTLVRRFGSYEKLRSNAQAWCAMRDDFLDVVPLLAHAARSPRKVANGDSATSNGFVYMIKHGTRSDYKIGKTFNPVRREGEIRLQLPDKVAPVHYIETDDPSGVEAYWHSRFAAKRKEGEWFRLSADDVKAFKKWRRIS